MAIPPMDENLRQLLSAFNDNRVKYVVVGGYAVFVHAQPRMTKDMDVFIESSPANAKAVYAALKQFGAPLSEITVEDFQHPTMVVRIGVPPICVDILQSIDGLDFTTVYAGSIEYLIDDAVPARYISADDLITNKLAAGRPQDLADVAAIRQARIAQKRSGKI
jgi:predicted nucleotidyltransferase